MHACVHVLLQLVCFILFTCIEAAELQAGGVPIPPDYVGQTKSYTLTPLKYCTTRPDAGTIGVMCLSCSTLYMVHVFFVLPEHVKSSALPPRWTINCFYISNAKCPLSYKVNKQGGVSLSRGKHDGSWEKAYKTACIVAGWIVPLQQHAWNYRLISAPLQILNVLASNIRTLTSSTWPTSDEG